jgi:hypothetical protein
MSRIFLSHSSLVESSEVDGPLHLTPQAVQFNIVIFVWNVWRQPVIPEIGHKISILTPFTMGYLKSSKM